MVHCLFAFKVLESWEPSEARLKWHLDFILPPSLAWVNIFFLNDCDCRQYQNVTSEQWQVPDVISSTETIASLFGVTLEWRDPHCPQDRCHSTSTAWESQPIENPRSVDWNASYLASFECTERLERSNWVRWLAFSCCQLTLPGSEELWSNFHFKGSTNKCKQSVSKATVQVLVSWSLLHCNVCLSILVTAGERVSVWDDQYRLQSQ